MRKLTGFILIFIVNTLFQGCSSSGRLTGYELENEQGATHLTTNDGELSIRKVLFSGYLSMTVHHPDSAIKAIEKIASKYDGYVNETGTFRMIIRVEHTQFNEAVHQISKLGSVKGKSVTGEDVTEVYFDYQVRLENAQKSRERYLELLAKAENVEAALKVEKELERLNEVIELLKGKMKRIDHLSRFSTITVDLKEKKKPGLLGYIGIGTYHAFKWMFVRN